MLITVGASSQRLDAILTPAQKTQIYGANPKNAPDRVLLVKVKTAGRTIYLENNAAATTAAGMSWSHIDGMLIIPVQGFSDLNVIASAGSTEVLLLAM